MSFIRFHLSHHYLLTSVLHSIHWVNPTETNVAAIMASVTAPKSATKSGLARHDRGAAPLPSVAIRLTNVHKTYLLGLEGVPALRGVDVTIKKGEFVVVLGKSGGGKTSLLNIIGTVDRPTRGELYVGGVRVDNKSEWPES